jgi:cytochrome c oxidase assembly factor CtaG
VNGDPAASLDAGNARNQALWPGLAIVGVVLLAAVMVPPLETLARRYLFVESIQFCVLAIVGPALIVLGAPWRPGRVSAGQFGSQAQFVPGLAARMAARRSGRPSFVWAAGFLGAWVGLCVLWRLPPVLDGLARHPGLLAAELVTLLPAGTCLWLELVNSPPFVPRLTRPRRAAIAALAMWSIWVIAYILGFALGSVVHAYDGAGSSLATVADQEITAGLLWFVSACSFLPVVFTSLLTWIQDDAGSGEELPRPGVSGIPGVRGWAGR